MRRLLTGLAVLGSLAVAVSGQAAIGAVDMTWDGCAGGPVDKTTNVGASYDIFITVTGHDEAHVAYELRVYYGNASQEVPDAWRFDAEGCQGSARITQDVAAHACTPFSQNAAGALQIKKVRFTPPTEIFAPTLMQVLLANSYTPVESVNPATRYLLERIRFDLSDAIPGAGSPPATCGGFEQPVCFKLWYAWWLDLEGIERPFHLSSPTLAVSFNEPSACSALPVQAKTWGSIKSQYRD